MKLLLPLLTVAVITACGNPTGQAGPVQREAAEQRAAHTLLHVHGVTREPSDGKIYLATHTGLYRYEGGTATRVSPDIDLMGFTVVGPQHYYASGHPGSGVDLPQPVGLIETRDGGRSWKVLSRGGESDFHALTATRAGVVGFDGAVRVTKDGTSWTKGTTPGDVASLAAAPGGSAMLAATPQGVFTSADHGTSWTKAPGVPLLTMLAWADKATATGITVDGTVAVSSDAGRTWKAGAARPDTPAQATSASRTSNGKLEVLLVTQDAVNATTDGGTTFVPAN